MKALTISQPYASLIASGEKFVENRTWYTDYRGPLAIHAGKGTQYLTRAELASYPTSCIVAVANLVACVDLDRARRSHERGLAFGALSRTGITLDQFLNHEHTEGPICWVLQDVRKLDPFVPCSGARGLWDFDESLIPEEVLA